MSSLEIQIEKIKSVSEEHSREIHTLRKRTHDIVNNVTGVKMTIEQLNKSIESLFDISVKQGEKIDAFSQKIQEEDIKRGMIKKFLLIIYNNLFKVMTIGAIVFYFFADHQTFKQLLMGMIK